MISLRAGSATDIGRVRNSNQDVALVDDELFAVADGMGGHVGGEVAARLAVETLRTAFARQPTVDGLRRAVAEANRAIWRESQADTRLRGMGTTLTATALVRSGDGSEVVALANVGDSRAYVYSDGQVVQVTDDHSLAEEKVRQGELTEAEAAVHPHRHILTRALGVASDVDVDLWELRLQTGDRVLLCSDGLTNEVPDERIGAILAQAREPDRAADELVRVALDAGGNDNITVVVVDVVGSPSAQMPPSGAVVPAGAPAPVETQTEPETEPEPEPADPQTSVLAVPAVVPAGGGGPAPARPTETLAVTGVVATVAPATVAPTPPRRDPTGEVPAVMAPSTTRSRRSGESRRIGGSGGSIVPGSAPTDGSRLVSTSPRALRPGPERDPDLMTRRERRRARRRAGIPRLITIRVIIFLALLGGIVYGGYYLIRWYANDDWYVTVENAHLTVFQGRPGGFLWYKPKLVFESPVTTADIPTTKTLVTLKRPHEEPSLKEAKNYITTLHNEYLATQQLSTGSTPNPITTTTAPTATTTATKPPATTTTTKPAATTTTAKHTRTTKPPATTTTAKP